MISNPDLPGSDSHVWERHLMHHLSRAQDTCEKEQDNIKELQTQLLKLQHTEARQKTQEKNRKKGEPIKIMMTAEQNQNPDLYPVPPWVPPPLQQQRGYSGGSMRGRGGRRGGVRGGPAQPGGGRCYYCEEIGHWVRDCPHLRKGGGRGGPAGGRGGRSRGRGWASYGPPTEAEPYRTNMPAVHWEPPEEWDPQYQ